MQVLGPAVAQERLGGAGAWAAILTAGALLVGNLTMLLIPAVWRIEARQPEGAWLRSTT